MMGEVSMMFFIKNGPFYGQFGHKYDRACIWDEIVYNFINFKKVFTVESDSFNCEISADEPVQVNSHPQKVDIGWLFID